MFIRRTQTRTTTTGEAYFTHRLVRSERIGDKVRQRTLLNLGRHFDAAQSDWPALCRRIDEVLGGQLQLAPDCPPALESHAQHIAAQLLARHADLSGAAAPPQGQDFQQVDGRVAPGDCSPEALTRTGQGDFHHRMLSTTYDGVCGELDYVAKSS